MRDYGKVHSSFWTSADMRELSEDGRTLAIYLLTCPHGTIAGCFRLPDGYVADDLQWSSQRVSKGFAELLAKGFANRCENTKWVWICKHLLWNPPENPNQRKAALKIARQIPTQCGWIAQYIRDYAEMLALEDAHELKPLPNGSETVSKPVTVTVAVTEPVTVTVPVAKTATRFDDFWAAWPQNERKQDRRKCFDKWKTDSLDPLADKILSDIAARKTGQKWANPKYIEAPLVYLNNARWNDGFVPDRAISGPSQNSDAARWVPPEVREMLQVEVLQ